MEENKKLYECPAIEVVVFGQSDVVTSSDPDLTNPDPDKNNELPIVPA